MTVVTVDLDVVATALQVHQRTVLRIYTGDRNAYWVDKHNVPLNIDAIARTFGCDVKVIQRAISGRDLILTPQEASRALKLNHRTFVWRRYTPTIKVGKVVRYARSALMQENLIRWG